MLLIVAARQLGQLDDDFISEVCQLQFSLQLVHRMLQWLPRYIIELVCLLLALFYFITFVFGNFVIEDS